MKQKEDANVHGFNQVPLYGADGAAGSKNVVAGDTGPVSTGGLRIGGSIVGSASEEGVKGRMQLEQRMRATEDKQPRSVAQAAPTPRGRSSASAR